MPDLAKNMQNVENLARAARRCAATIATDPDVRFYSADTISLVLRETLLAYIGAGSWEAAEHKLSENPNLADVPIEAIVAISKATLVHFARALSELNRDAQTDGGPE